MKPDYVTLLENEYLAKILGFAYQKLNDRNEAEDLASDITLEVLKVIRSGKEIENFNALVWSISNHVFFKRLRRKKYGDTAYLTELFEASDNVEAEALKREQENLLRRELAFLAEKYRRAVVLHYFEGKSCEETGELLGQSAGTIKWWLHEARTFIKEGMDGMREYGEKSFNPGYLFVSCQGNLGADNEPVSCAKRKLAQNILLTAYEEPVSVKDLCVELGVSAAYIEDEVAVLVENQLMKEVSRGKYQTDFVILQGNNHKVLHGIYAACFPEYYEKLINFLEGHKELLSTGKFNLPGFTWERLLWVYIHMITEFALDAFRVEQCKIVCYQEMPQRPKGGKWIALGFKGGTPDRIQEGVADWAEYVSYDGPVHKCAVSAQGFFHYWSGTDSTPFFEIPDELFQLQKQVLCGDITGENLEKEQKLLVSYGVEKKLFHMEGEQFVPDYYYVMESERHQLLDLGLEFYTMEKPLFQKAWKLVREEQEKTVPKHLHWQMNNFLSNALNSFVTCSLYEGMKNKALSDPEVEGREWLSMFVFHR
ncbi:MAG: RNA polymerase sigma factor [Lachnospiraceae bacterium]|nr:RNA polymerase sigma factor [Lachnospiraceae bacterium]